MRPHAADGGKEAPDVAPAGGAGDGPGDHAARGGAEGGRKTAQGLALRARIVLASAEGCSNTAAAARLGISRVTVIEWRVLDLEQALGIYRDLGNCAGRAYSCRAATATRAEKLEVQ